MAQSDNMPVDGLQCSPMLKIPYLSAKPGGAHPPMCLEAWKDMFHIAVQAKLRVNIGELLNSREPEYIEPKLQDPVEDGTADQKKKRDSNDEKGTLKAMKDHEDRIFRNSKKLYSVKRDNDIFLKSG